MGAYMGLRIGEVGALTMDRLDLLHGQGRITASSLRLLAAVLGLQARRLAQGGARFPFQGS